ncbi:putative MFS allantoate transporter, partial [Aureobasidium melanogenum]
MLLLDCSFTVVVVDDSGTCSVGKQREIETPSANGQWPKFNYGMLLHCHCQQDRFRFRHDGTVTAFLANINQFIGNIKLSRTRLLSRLQVYRSSQAVHELGVLSIGEIEPSAKSIKLCLLSVLPLAVPPDEKQVDETNAPADNNGDFGRSISRRILRLKALRTDDVSSTVCHKVHGSNGGFLGIASHICSDKTEQRNERCRRRLSQIVTRETARVVVQRQGDNQNHAEQRDRQAGHGHQDPLAQLVTEPAAKHESNNFDCPAWCAESASIVQYPGDSEGKYIRNQGIKHKSPRQRVREGLFQLVHFEMLVPNPLLIDPNTFDGKNTVAGLQPSRVELVVGHDEKEDDPQRSRCNGRAVFSSADRDAVGHQTAEDLTEAVEGKPDACPGALLALGVPLTGILVCMAHPCPCIHYSFERITRKSNTKVKQAQQLTSNSHSSTKPRHRRKQGQHNSPSDNAKGRIFRQRQSLQKSICRILPCQIAKVEHTPEPLVVVTFEPQILLDTHDAGVRQGRLVQVVESINDAQQRHEMPIDDPQETFVGRLVDLQNFAAGKRFHGLVGIIAIDW